MHDKDHAIYKSIAKSIVIPVIVFVIILLCGAVAFYKERMLFIDAPHILFRIINDGTLQLPEHRYGAFITQLLPFAASKMHLPLQWLMIIYSASFYAFFIVITLSIIYKYKNYGLAVLFGLYLSLFASDTFFWPNNEIHQGIAWLLLAFAITFSSADKKQPSAITTLLFILFFALAIWTHPVVMIVALYLWFFLMSGRAVRWPFSRPQSVIYTILLLLLSYAKFYQGQHHGYDSGKIESVTLFDLHKIKGILSAPQLHFFVKGCITNYWLFVLVFIAGIAGLLKEKKYLSLMLTLGFSGGYLLLLCITYWDVNTNRFYMESEYMPLSIICAAPFVYYVLPKPGSSTGIVILSLIFCIRLGYIFHSAPMFTNRVTLMEQIDAKMKEKDIDKAIIINADSATNSTLVMNWGAPVESLFLSIIKNEQPQSTFIFADSAQLKVFNTAGRDSLVESFEKRRISALNNDYFRPDTTHNYTVISFANLMQ